MDKETLLIIGGTGTLGSFLLKQFSSTYKVISVNRNEKNMVMLYRELPDVTFLIADITNKNSIKRILNDYKPNYIINTAALKHIDVCDRQVEESLNINILANINLLDSIKEIGLLPKSIIYISTDKVCNPSGVYGMSKGIAERLYLNEKNLPCTVTRFGNIINSSGSIIPVLKSLLDSGGTKLTITDPEMTRLMMTTQEIFEILQSVIKSPNQFTNKLVIPSISSFKLLDLFSLVINAYSDPSKITIQTSGPRKGEKIHEELVTEEEYREGNIIVSYDNEFSDIANYRLETFKSKDRVLSRDSLKVYLTHAGVL